MKRSSALTFARARDVANRLWQAHATPLMTAAELGHEGIVRILLSAGADVNAQNQVVFILCFVCQCPPQHLEPYEFSVMDSRHREFISELIGHQMSSNVALEPKKAESVSSILA